MSPDRARAFIASYRPVTPDQQLALVQVALLAEIADALKAPPVKLPSKDVPNSPPIRPPRKRKPAAKKTPSKG